jgi:DNA-binding GntR family transcriptional regulator
MKAIPTPRNLKQAVYERLKNNLVKGNLPPGSKLVETEISRSLGVSRTPLREAFGRLQQDGLIEILPRRGAFVKKQSLEEVLESLELREVLEGLAIRLLCRHRQPEIILQMKSCFRGFTVKNIERSLEPYAHRNVRFHNLIIDGSGNRKLIAAIRNLYDQMDMVRLHTISLPGRARKSLTEHLRIIDLVEKGRGDLAERELRAHIRTLRDAVPQVYPPRPKDGT